MEDIDTVSEDRQDIFGRDLPIGSRHYRAFVGPPAKYDMVSAMQFNLLTALGLKENHYLLDIGCGSLRGGRLFIPYLLKGRYFGIEPEQWLIDEGIKNEVGNDLIDVKQPVFNNDDSFTLSIFNRKFDFILAQSIFSHASQNQIRKCLSEARKVMIPTSVFAATFVEGKENYIGDEWVYPYCVTYELSYMITLIEEQGLVCKPIKWPHPNGQTWLIIVRRESGKRISFLGGGTFKEDVRSLQPNYDEGRARQEIHEKSRKEMRFLSICPKPIFVVGCPRSGTSVLAHSLARHSQTWVSAESNFLIPLSRLTQEVYASGTQRGDKHWLSKEGVSFAELLEFIGYGINALYTSRSDGLRWIEQTPEYTLDLHNLSSMFPRARFLHIVRDGRNVVNSMIHSDFPEKWASDFTAACETWVRFVKAALEYESLCPDRVLRVYLEALSHQVEEEFRRIHNYLDLPYEEATTELLKSGICINSSFTDSNRKRLSWEESWSDEQKGIFERICGSLQKELGYRGNVADTASVHRRVKGFTPFYQSVAPKERDILVVVLGMHRSGTSLITHILSNAGFFIGKEEDIMPGNRFNSDGYFERLSVVEANDTILKLSGGNWHIPPEEEDIVRIRIDPFIESIMKTYQGHNKSVLKDPRLCLTLPVWEKLWGENVRLIIMNRDAKAIAASLKERDGFSHQESIELCRIYRERASRYSRNYPAFSIEYEDLFTDRRDEILRRLADFLGIDTDLEVIAKQVVNPSLQHYKADNLVSIIIPVFNKLELTHQCLKSILKNTRYPNYEIIVVDNGSTDGTAEYLKKMEDKGVRSVIHSENLGFVSGCNSGADVARGGFLLFLNNDTEVQPGWLSALIQFAEKTPDCGAVGSKLVYPNGKLQEAGGIIFSDGNGWNYGRNMNPDDPRFNFVREVDYCSGAALMVRKDLWDRIGGFDERYSPAYYEDTDLCFAVRKLGYKIYYEPDSVIIHHEGQTAGNDLESGFKRYQKINRAKFVEKWTNELQSQYSNDPGNVSKASIRGANRSILVVDPFLPEFDKASGSLRLFQILKMLKQMNFHVTFIARGGLLDSKYCPALEDLGMEVYPTDVEAMRATRYDIENIKPINYQILFKERQFDYAILSSWDIAEYYLPLVRKLSPQTKIIVDTVDIHFLREGREAEIAEDPALLKRAMRRKKREIAIYKQADRLWVVTESDKGAIERMVGNIPIDVVPNIHEEINDVKEFGATSDLLFVGNFNHTPNRDAIQFFCGEVFPLIVKELPDIKVYIVGNNPPEAVKALSCDRVIVTGYVADLSPYLGQARISVNPLRYGAGMKGKIGEALSWGLPVVTTSIGAEGMGLVDGEHALIADDPPEFARKTVELYNDEKIWDTLSRNGKGLVEANWSPGIVKRKIESILLRPGQQPKVNPVVSIIILTYNALEYTKKCVDSIREYTTLPHEIIFIDNGSGDGTVDYLRELVTENDNYALVENDRNLGFAAGNNQAMKTAQGKYMLLLNNDVLLSPLWLDRMVECAEMDETIGLVGPLSNNVSGFQKVENLTYDDPADYLDVALKVAKINHKRHTPRRRIAGFAMLIKRAVYEKIGGLDERFGSGNYEDDDYCLRAREAGFKIMVAEDVFIHHFGSQTFKQNRISYEKAIRRNRRLFEKKWPGIDPVWLIEKTDRLIDVNASHVFEAQQALESGDTDKAIEAYSKVLDTNPIDVGALYGMGLAYQMRGEVEKAIKKFTRVTEIVPSFGAVYNNLGILWAEKGDSQKALTLFTKAVGLDSDNLDAKRNLSSLMIDLEQYQEGIQLLQAILDEHPYDVPSLNQMGILCAEAGKAEKAKSYFRRVLELDPEHEEAQHYLNVTQLQLSRESREEGKAISVELG